MECLYKNRSHWKNIPKEKNSQTSVCCLCVNLPTVKIWGPSDKFPMSSSFLQCQLQVKKLIRENSSKYVNQTGNFYFRSKLKTAISLPIFNPFNDFFFALEISFGSLLFNQKKWNLKKIVDLKVYCNHKMKLTLYEIQASSIKLTLSMVPSTVRRRQLFFWKQVLYQLERQKVPFIALLDGLNCLPNQVMWHAVT